MLLLIFEAGGQSYGLDTRTVIEVAAYPECTRLPQAPSYVAGIVTWRGCTIPVIDVSALLAGTPARPLLSTRLLVVEYPTAAGCLQPLGLLVEKAVETVFEGETRHEPQKVTIPDAPYLGGTAVHEDKLIPLLELHELLPASLRELLYPDREAA